MCHLRMCLRALFFRGDTLRSICGNKSYLVCLDCSLFAGYPKSFTDAYILRKARTKTSNTRSNVEVPHMREIPEAVERILLPFDTEVLHR